MLNVTLLDHVIF